MWYVITCVSYEMFIPLRFFNHFPSSTSESGIKVAKLPAYAELFHGLDMASKQLFGQLYTEKASNLSELCDDAARLATEARRGHGTCNELQQSDDIVLIDLYLPSGEAENVPLPHKRHLWR